MHLWLCVVTCKYCEMSRTGHGNEGWSYVRGFDPIFSHLIKVRRIHTPVIIPPEMAAIFTPVNTYIVAAVIFIYLLTYLIKI